MKNLDKDGRPYNLSQAEKSRQLTKSIASLSILCIGAFVVGVLMLHVLNRNLSPVRHMVSEYALGDFGWIQTINFALIAFGAVALALSLNRTISLRGRYGPVLIGAFGLCIFLDTFAKTDIKNGPITTHGMVHNVATSLGFVLLIAGMFVMVRSFRTDPDWIKMGARTKVWGVSASVTFFLQPIMESYAPGIGQRIFLSVCLSWMLLTAYQARSLAR